MKEEGHLRNLCESLDTIREAVQKGLADRQRNIGFHTSAAMADMFELYLHRQKLINAGFMIKHEWFTSEKKLKRKLNFDFPRMAELLPLAAAIEKERNKLCYGIRQPEEIIEKVINNFNLLKQKFLELGLNELKE